MMRKQVITLNSSTENLKVFRDFIINTAKDAGFSDDDIYKIELAVDEACTNIIKHAYQSDPNKEIRIEVETRDNRFLITIQDFGRDFNEASYHEPNLEESVKQRKRGGLGIHLIRSFMDHVEYSRVGNQNILHMTKTIK